VYAAIEALALRLPETASSADPVGVDPERVPLDRRLAVATMIRAVGDRPLQPLLAYLPWMGVPSRCAFAAEAGRRGVFSPDVRAALVTMVGDHSSEVRRYALEAMGTVHPDVGETIELEELLTRKAGDLRRGLLRCWTNCQPKMCSSQRRACGLGLVPRAMQPVSSSRSSTAVRPPCGWHRSSWRAGRRHHKRSCCGWRSTAPKSGRRMVHSDCSTRPS
jgi:hypothetical protein